ncbi:MAG: peptidylprolyl isomerase [Kiloniellales bacterium]
MIDGLESAPEDEVMRTTLAGPVILAMLLAAPLLAHGQDVTDPVTILPLPGFGDEPEPPSPDEGSGTVRLGSALKGIGKDNPVLARVNGSEIRWADVVASARDLPPDYRGQIELIFPALVERLIDLRLIISAGREEGLAEDEKVRRAVDAFENRVISEAFIRREVAGQITNAMLRERYDARLKRQQVEAEVRARHILLEREEDAWAVIAKLEAGADFPSLARKHSAGPTAEQGGDLDYFRRGDMVAEFADAAFALQAGEYSREPVKTQFGWHVIKVEDRRGEVAGSFFRMRPELRKEVSRELLNKLLRKLRAQAKIELYPGSSPVQ